MLELALLAGAALLTGVMIGWFAAFYVVLRDSKVLIAKLESRVMQARDDIMGNINERT